MKEKNMRKPVIYLKGASNDDDGSVIALSEHELMKLYNGNPNYMNIHAAFAEYENTERSNRIKHGIRRRKELKIAK